MRFSISRMTTSTILIKSVLFVAGAPRAPITVVGPLIEVIRSTFDLGATVAGFLTTVPLLAFAAISPFAAWLNKYGLEKSLFVAIMLIAAGILLRSAGSPLCLYIGTCIIGCGIAVGNVLLPSLVKRDFLAQITPLTAQCVGYGLAAAGPPLIGASREIAATWTVPLLICAAVCVAMGALGLLAGRSGAIEMERAGPNQLRSRA
jgi:cyanate permease